MVESPETAWNTYRNESVVEPVSNPLSELVRVRAPPRVVDPAATALISIEVQNELTSDPEKGSELRHCASTRKTGKSPKNARAQRTCNL